MNTDNARHSYEFRLLLTTLAPLSHGSGTLGNTQVLRTTDMLAEIDGKWRKLRVPAVSGGSFKAILREHAVSYYLQRLGVEEGGMNRDHLRLLLKGGKVSSGGQSVSHDEVRRLRRLYPPLAVFGFMEGNMSAPGQLSVTEVQPYAVELVEAGVLAGWGGLVPASPVPMSMIRSEVTYYAHDMNNGRQAKMLKGEERKLIEEAQTKRAATGKATADVRRAASEAMPHSYQVIAKGVPLVATIRLRGASEVDVACLMIALSEWRRHGGILGGASGSKGHGQTSVKVVSGTRFAAGLGPVEVDANVTLPVETVDAEAGMQGMIERYHAHLDSVRAEVLAEVAA